jgi:hypothetical protein
MIDILVIFGTAPHLSKEGILPSSRSDFHATAAYLFNPKIGAGIDDLNGQNQGQVGRGLAGQG